MKNFNINNINNDKKDISIYVHIPFCESRCHYCDFFSSVIDNAIVKKYFQCLNKEIILYSDLLKNKNTVSIFFGGGTPSSVDSLYIADTLNLIKNNTNIANNCEITIECNPNSLTEKKLLDYINAGFNRFSIGAQSFNEKILKSIGRIHKKNDIINAINLFKKYNIKNYSFDLMLALPYQTFNDIKESVEMIKVLNPSHISYYSLIVEDNTLMSKIYDNNPSIFPSEYDDRKMYHYIVNSLNNLGYRQYEISNFAKDNMYSRHNMRYWTLDDYIGFGVSAHSNIGNIRYFNYSDFNEYFNKIGSNALPVESFEELDIKDRINEFSIMGLRMNKGIDIKLTNIRFNIDYLNYYKAEIEKNLKSNLIEIKNESIMLTEKGRDLSNIVEVDFIKLHSKS